MNILIMGGDGFLGSHFVDKAVSLGHKATVFDRFHRGISMNLEHQRGKVRFLAGDFEDPKQVTAALEDQDIVYHFISSTNPVIGWRDPFIEIENSLKVTVRFFELAAGSGVKKIVFPSSGGSVYGRQQGPIEEHTLPAPFNPHGITKLTIEHFLNYLKKRTGIAADIYRIGNAYGPRQPVDNSQGVIAVWLGRISRGDEIRVYGDRETIRDYVYVSDAAFLMTHSLTDLMSSDMYNLGTGRGVSILELLNIFRASIDEPIRFSLHPRRTLDNTAVILNSAKLTSFFPGFTFQKLEDKIPETWSVIKGRKGQGITHVQS